MNGPLGYYEKGYTDGSTFVLQTITKPTFWYSKNRRIVVGGGNTVDFVRDSGYAGNIDFLSTAGGAMIEYLTDSTGLPGIKSLED